MSALETTPTGYATAPAERPRPRRHGLPGPAVPLEAFGELEPISRLGGQGRVYRPELTPPAFGRAEMVVKLYRRSPPASGARVLAQMVIWKRSLESSQRVRLSRLAAWPDAVVRANGLPVGIAMPDVRERFSVPFVMPSGRREQVLLSLEHLLGGDAYLQLRGIDVRLDTAIRAQLAERISSALAFLHRHAIVASDISPSNMLVSFGPQAAAVCLIDCDSMVFRGRRALDSVETGDWQMPPGFAEPADTRAADAYKLGLVILRLFARSHDARAADAHMEHVPARLRPLLSRALAPDPANRPPAGEWQRALRQLLASGQLNELYPGPDPHPRVTPVRSAGVESPRRPTAVAAPPAASRPRRPSPRPRPYRPSPPPGGDWLRRAVVVSWLLAGTVVLFLILSRMFAAAMPSQDGGGGGIPVGAGSGAVGNGSYTYQYYPRRFAPGGGTVQVP